MVHHRPLLQSNSTDRSTLPYGHPFNSCPEQKLIGDFLKYVANSVKLITSSVRPVMLLGSTISKRPQPILQSSC